MKKIVSAVTAAALSILSLSFSSNSISAAKPEMGDWIPHNFFDAMTFKNTYGTTHIGNYPGGPDIACFVFQSSAQSKEDYSYESTCETLNVEYHEVFSELGSEIKYEVLAVSDFGKKPVSFDVSYGSDTRLLNEYSFSSDGKGRLTETDIFSWVPDCYTEFREYERAHDMISVVNGYVTFCSVSIPGAGYEWGFRQSGNGKLKPCFKVNCNEQNMISHNGGESLDFIMFKPEADGDVKTEWTYCKFGDSDAADIIVKNFEISNNCEEIIEIGEIKEPEDPDDYSGDANEDGIFDINDVVFLQKYLFGISDASDEEIKNADMNKDGIINIADLCLIKSELIAPEPDVLNEEPLPLTGKVKDYYYKITNTGNYNSNIRERGYMNVTENSKTAPFSLLISMGEKSTGGYSIYITDIILDDENNLTVFVNETSPKPDEMVTQAFTYPCCKVSIETDDLPKSVSVKNIYGKEFKELTSADQYDIMFGPDVPEKSVMISDLRKD